MTPQDRNIKYMHDELSLLMLDEFHNLHVAMECHKNTTNPESGLYTMFIPLEQVGVRPARLTENQGLVVLQDEKNGMSCILI